MSRKGGSREVEEKYLEERDRNLLLRKKNNEQENTIKRLYTKIQMIEEGLRRRGHGSTMDASKNSSPSNKLDDRANGKLIDDLRKRNASLQKANTDLREKLRLSLMENKKKAGTKRVLIPRRSNKHGNTAPVLSRDENLQGMLKGFAATTSGGEHDRKTRDLVDALRNRLVSTEKRLQKMVQDNKELRVRAEVNHGGAGGSPRSSGHGLGGGHHAHSADVLELQRELRDKNAQLTLLNSRFEHLEGRHRAGQEMHNRALAKMEDDNRTIRDMRRKLQMLGAEKEELEGFKERCADLDQEVGELRRQATELEESMGRLCESPFINTAYKSEKEMMELRKHRKDAKHQQYQIDFLQEAVKSWRDRVADLTQKLQGVMNEKEALSREKQELEIKLEEYDRSNELLKDKMRLYSGETGIDTADLERALTLVKRHSERPAEVDFLDGEFDQADDMQAVPALKRKVQTLQIKILEQVRELERADRMVKAQSSINRDLNTELEALKSRYTSDRSTLQKKVDDMEHVASKRTARVKTLEAQLKQFMRSGGANVDLSMMPTENSGVEARGTISATSGLASDAADFEPGENILEIYIVNASFAKPDDVAAGAIMFGGKSTRLNDDATTFVMCDFYDYETQTTPIMSGLNPQYNFAATYKVEVDHFFLRHISSESLVLEVNLARHADFELVGQCVLRLVDLINDNPSNIYNDAPILSVRDGSIIGHLNVRIKLALPVTELFNLYLRENPSERQRVERLRLADQTVAIDQAEKARQSNYLEVVVVRCTKLRTRNGRDPAAYVGYKLFSFQDCVTEIADEGCEPTFDAQQALPLTIDQKLMRALRKEQLEMTVFDDLDSGDEPIGMASIPLTALAAGEPVVGPYDLRSPSGSFAGQVHVSIRWRIPLQTAGGISGSTQAERELTGHQVRYLERRFESKRSGNGDTVSGQFVGYRHFLQYVVPRAELITVQNKLREATARDRGASLKKALRRFEKDGRDAMMSLDDVRDAFEEIRGGLLTSTELRVAFSYLDPTEEGSVDPESLMAFSSAPGTDAQVTEDKLRSYFRTLHRQRPNFREEFHRYDANSTGLMTRPEFRQALMGCGMELLDDAKGLSSGKGDNKSHGEESGNQVNYEWGDSAPGGEDIVTETRGSTSGAKQVISQYDVLNKSLKMEFQTRMSDASRASAVAAAQMSVPLLDLHEQKQMKRSDALQEEHAAALRLQTRFRGLNARKEAARRKRGGRGNVSDSEDDMEAGITRAENELRDRVREVTVSNMRTLEDIESAVARFDHGNGKITRAELNKGLRAVDIDLSKESLKVLFHHFDRRGDGKIKYKEFVSFATLKPSKGGQIIRKLRSALWKVDPATAFNIMDKDHDGKISPNEFKAGVERMGLKGLSSEEIDELMGHFMLSNKESIDLRAFIDFAADAQRSVDDRLGGAEKALRELVEKAQAKGINIQQSFKAFDKNNDGIISKSEFEKTMGQLSEALGITLTPKETSQLFARFSGSRRATFVEYDAFVSYMMNDSTAKEEAASSESKREEWRKKTQDIKPVREKALQTKARHVTREAARQEHDVVAYFDRYDPEPRRGRVRSAEFTAAADHAGFFFTLSEARWLCEKFKNHTVRDGVNYHDFLFWSTESAARVEAVGTKLRVSVANAARMSGSDDGLNFGPTFRAFDPHDTKRITPANFREGLEKLQGIKLSAQEVQTLMDHFDKDSGGNIQYEDFITFVLGEDSQRRPARPSSAAPKKIRDGDKRPKPNTEATEEAIKAMKKLKGLVRQAASKGVDYRDSFEHFDPALTGRITRKDFRRGLDKLGIKLLDDEMDALMNRFDPENSGRIRYADFLGIVAPEREKKLFDEETDKAVKKLRALVRQRAKQKKGSFRDPFAHFSEKKSSFISSQLHEGLKLLGIELPADKVSSIFEMMDKNEDGKVTYNEFKLFIGDSHFSDVENRLRSMITRLASDWSGHQSFRKVFDKFDDDREGSLSRRRFKQCLEELGFTLTSAEFERVLDRFDVDGDGTVSYKEFVKFIQNRYDQYKPLERLRSELQKMAGNDQKTMWQTFRNLDLDGNGFIDKHEFKDGLKELGFDELSSSQTNDIISYFDFHGDGRVSYEEFVEFVSPAGGNGNSSRGNGRQRSTGKVMLRMRKIFRKVWSAGGKDVHDLFAGFDTDFEGFLSSKKVFSLLRSELDATLSEDDETELIKLFAPTSKSEFDYVDFLARVSPSYSGGAIAAGVNKAAGSLRLLVRQRASSKGGDLRDPFNHFDRKRKGYFGMREFSKGIRSLGIKLSSGDEEKLFDLIDFNTDGKVKFNEFAVFADGAKFADATSRLRAKIATIAKKWNGGRDLRKAFDRFDSDGSGAISKREFKKALDSFGLLDLSSKETDQLIKQFDTDGDGRISFREFIEFVHGHAENFENADGTLERMKKKIKDMGEAWRVFEDMDKDGNGILDKKEFEQGLRELDSNLTTSEVRKIMKCFDPEGHGYISWDNFADSIGVVHASGGRRRIESSRHQSFDSGSDEETNSRSNRKRGAKTSSGRMPFILKEVRSEVRKHWKQGTNYHEMFARHDRQGRGWIGEDDFLSALKEGLKVSLSRTDEKTVVDRFDRGERGEIDYMSFLSMISPSYSGGYGDEGAPAEVTDAANRLRTLIKARAKDMKGDLQDPFKHFDKKESGSFNSLSFEKGLAKLKIKLSSRNVGKLFRVLDTNGDGKVMMNEFAVFTFGSHSADAMNTLRLKITEIGRRWDGGRSIRKAFSKCRSFSESGGKDYVSLRDFRHVLEDQGFTFSSQQEVESIAVHFDMFGDGQIACSEFIKFVEERMKRFNHVDALHDTIRDQIKSSARKHGSSKDVRSVFEEMDTDGNGVLDKSEFANGLTALGVKVSKRDVDALVDYFDHTPSSAGKVSWEDFADFVNHTFDGAGSEGRLPSALTTVAEKIDEEARSTGFKIQEELEKLDRKERDYVKDVDFEDLLRDIGVKKSTAKELTKSYDLSGSGRVEYLGFLDDLKRSGRTKKEGSSRKGGRKTIDRSTAKILKRFRRHFEDRPKDFKRFKSGMKAIDARNRGTVNPRAFEDELFDCGLDISKSDYRVVETFYEDRDTGKILYQNFLEDTMQGDSEGSDRESGGRRRASSSSPRRDEADRDTAKAIKRLRRHFQDYPKHLKRFKSAVKELDSKKRGIISARDFESEIFDCGAEPSKEDCRLVRKFYEDRATGKVSYEEFLDGMDQ